jgi:hypothetical protein
LTVAVLASFGRIALRRTPPVPRHSGLCGRKNLVGWRGGIGLYTPVGLLHKCSFLCRGLLP